MMNFELGVQDVVPVPIAFLKKYMPGAPPAYVKVYLYGLCLAHGCGNAGDMEMERTLCMTSLEIRQAVSYWQDAGLVSTHDAGGNLSLRFLPIPESSPPKAVDPPPLYAYKDYNEKLASLLKRPLSPSDLQRIYDFTDVYGLPAEVVLKMIEHCVSLKGAAVNIAYINKVARTWADNRIDTDEKAQRRLEEYKLNTSGIREVMRRMGIGDKNPDQLQAGLYVKWMDEWGFTLESILFAMENVEFSGGSPFKYLDAILQNFYDKGITTSSEISEYVFTNNKKRKHIKEALKALDYSRMYIDSKKEEYYEEWERAGFSHDIILLACAQSVNNGSRRFESVDKLLNDWRSLGLLSVDDIQKHIKKQDTIGQKMKLVYDNAGIRKDIGEADRQLYLTYTVDNGMSHDVLMYAASVSYLADEPSKYLRKVLGTWAKDGVKTLHQAKEQDMNRFAKDMKNPRSFEQHAYTPEDMAKRKQDSLQRLGILDGEEKKRSGASD